MASRTTKTTPAKKRDAKPSKRRRFAILDMPEVSWWEEQRNKPRFVFPHEYSRSPCASCAGLCCLASNKFTAVEATRIALTLMLPMPTFARATVLDGTEPAAHTVPIPLDSGDVVLSFVPKRQPQGDDTCLFLNRVGDVGRCSVHGVRPGVCRVYPYRVELDERELHAGAPLVCPTHWLQDKDVRRAVKKDVVGWLADLERERELIEQWRAHEGGDRSFAGFARWAASTLAPEMGLRTEELYPPRRRRLGDRLRGAPGVEGPD